MAGAPAHLRARPAAAGAGAASAGGSGRVRGLDGLRGFALLGMLAWHAELAWVKGGFARMTIFFVLSGYLATRSWVRRHDEGFGWFWLRRTLRLLPMTLVGVALAIAVTVAVGSQTTRAALGGDVVAVLTYTSNWHFLGTGQSYGGLFERQSAFQHYWSLSIEEQLFVALPLVLAATAVVARRTRQAPWALLVALAGAVVAVALAVAPSPDGIYFGTQTRLYEFLLGAALALSVPSWSTATGPAASAVVWLGRISAVAIVATLILVDRASAWLYDGGIYLFALPVVGVIAAVERRDRWLTDPLSLPPLVWLGRAALSIYVLHWPLFVLIDDRVGASLSAAALAALKVAVGVAVGGVAHRLVEQPLLDDSRRLLDRGRAALRVRLAPMVGLAGVLAVAGMGLRADAPDYEFEAAAAAFEESSEATDDPAAGAAPERRVAVFGASTALMNGLGLTNWSLTVEGLRVSGGDARLGCGLLQDGVRALGLDALGAVEWVPVEEECRGWPEAWEAKAAGLDAALVFFGVWEIADWRTPEGVTSIEDAAMQARIRAALEEGVDRLLAGGAGHVVLMTSPVVGGGVLEDAARQRALPSHHAERTAIYNDLVREVAAGRPGEVSVFDYGALIEGLGPDLPRLVPDGVHPTWDGAEELWSGPAGEALLAHLDEALAD